MALLIKCAKWGTLIYFLWSGITAGIITYSLGENTAINFSLFGSVYKFSIVGIAGEANYGWQLHAMTFVSRLAYVYGFYRLWRLFIAFDQRQYFAKEPIQHLKIFTGSFLLFTVLRIVIENSYVNFYTLEIGNVELDSSYWGDLFLPVLFYIVAHVLNQARKNEEEMENYF